MGYWAVDVLDAEPYTPGQYPYLIQAVQWAREFGISVSIDLHGLPGSQNGQDNSGITGVIEFAANQTNTDRALGVLRNLSAEFSRSVYVVVVRGACCCFASVRTFGVERARGYAEQSPPYIVKRPPLSSPRSLELPRADRGTAPTS